LRKARKEPVSRRQPHSPECELEPLREPTLIDYPAAADAASYLSAASANMADRQALSLKVFADSAFSSRTLAAPRRFNGE
jgi:hypothetical protein